MRRFEYRVMPLPLSDALSMKQFKKVSEELEETLNALGADGWELVQRTDGVLFFKREIE